MKQATLKKLLISGTATLGVIGLSSPAAFAMSNSYGSQNSYRNNNNYSNCPMMKYGNSNNYGWNSDGKYMNNMYGKNNNCMPMRNNYSSSQQYGNKNCDNSYD